MACNVSINLPTVDAGGVGTPLIRRVVLTLATTEYSYTLPVGTKQFNVLNEGADIVTLSYETGGSGDPTRNTEIDPNNSYEETGLNITQLTIYLQSASPAQTVKVISWS